MSVKATNYVWDHATRKGGHFAVLLALADFADDDGFSWYSLKKLANKARLTVRRAQQVLRDMEETGEVVTESRNRENGSATTNRYQVVMHPPEKITGAPLPKRLREAPEAGFTTPLKPASPLDPSGSPSINPPICAELALPASAPLQDEVVLIFPVVGKTSEWPLTAAKVAEYRATFPALDVIALMREARQWSVDNPRRRKTQAGMTKFTFGWLERAQNRGNRSPGASAQAAAPAKSRYEPDNWRELIRIHHSDHGPLMQMANGQRDWRQLVVSEQELIITAIRNIPPGERRCA